MKLDKGEDSHLREVKLSTQTSLYVDIVIIILVYAIALICVRKKWYIGLYLMLGAYLIVYAYLVFLGRKPYKTPQLHLDPFWSYRVAFDGFSIRHRSYAREILLNILLYIPLGIILAAIFRKHPFLWPLSIGLLLSILTETVQYFTRRGVTELDDVFDNTFGLLIGIALYLLTMKIIENRKKLC